MSPCSTLATRYVIGLNGKRREGISPINHIWIIEKPSYPTCKRTQPVKCKIEWFLLVRIQTAGFAAIDVGLSKRPTCQRYLCVLVFV
jgi:hypothetical protein